MVLFLAFQDEQIPCFQFGQKVDLSKCAEYIERGDMVCGPIGADSELETDAEVGEEAEGGPVDVGEGKWAFEGDVEDEGDEFEGGGREWDDEGDDGGQGGVVEAHDFPGSVIDPDLVVQGDGGTDGEGV